MKRASHGEQRKNAAGGSPEVRRSLPRIQPPLSRFAKLFLPFSTAPSRSSNLQKVRAGNPPSRGVGNPVALSGAGGHRYIILLSGKCLGALGLFWLRLRDLHEKITFSLMTQTDQPFHWARRHGRRVLLTVQLPRSSCMLFFSGMFSTILKIELWFNFLLCKMKKVSRRLTGLWQRFIFVDKVRH